MSEALRTLFAEMTAGQTHFTRRTAINMADMLDMEPMALIRRCEADGIVKPGTTDWFKSNGGISKANIEESRAAPRLSPDGKPKCGGEQ